MPKFTRLELGLFATIVVVGLVFPVVLLLLVIIAVFTAKSSYLDTHIDHVPKRLYDEYQEYLEGPIWPTLRLECLDRDDHMCQVCGTTNNLQVHHIHYDGIYEMTFTLDQLLTVCRSCHEEIHGREFT